MVVVVGLAGCKGLAGDLKGTSNEAQVAREALDALAKGNVDAVLSRWDPTLVDSDITAALGQVAMLFPHEPPRSVRVIGANRGQRTGGGDAPAKMCTITFESVYAHTMIVSAVVLRTDGSEPQLIGFHSSPAVAGNVKGVGVEQVPFVVTFIFLMIGAAGVTVAAIRVWIRRRKRLRHRILWLLAISLGLFRVDLMLSVGRIGFQLFAVQLFSVGFWGAARFTSWTLSLSLPVGAIVFLIRAAQDNLSPTVSPLPSVEPPLPPPGADT